MSSRATRRQFLKATAAGVAAGVGSALTAGAAERTSSYQGPIIDAHTHFYDPGRAQGVPWPPPEDKLLYRRVTPDDYRRLSLPQPVHGTVVVEASAWIEDNQWILDLAAREPFIVGFVGNLVAGSDGFEAHLTRLARNPIFRGIRMGAEALRQGLSSERMVSDLKLLASRDLTLDWLGGPEMLLDVTKIAKVVPDLRIIVDHVANVRIDGRGVDVSWHNAFLAVGQHHNVYCKVSGLVEGSGRTEGRAPANVAFYRPVLDSVWGAFGRDRLVYGSNWPVSERFAPCGVVQQLVTDYFEMKGRIALEKVFYSNSRDFYKWVHRQQ
jgi:predicted TIM-barrel fold metal-dependent hydrolase